ncbi:hypothetical protein ACT4UT_06015, partial [Bacillus sp. B-TM1]
MNGFMSFMEQKIMPTTQKIAGQRHLLAIRNGVISTLPLTIVGSFFVIFLNLPIDAYNAIKPTVNRNGISKIWRNGAIHS